MKTHTIAWFRAVALVGLVTVVGCASTRDTETFEPVPKAEIGKQDLEPVKPRSTTDLLRSANEAFQLANKAQETGDKEAALRHYTRMLEFLIEADLDPSIFYGLRSEFSQILDSTSQHHQLFASRPPIDYLRSRFEEAMVVGDIEKPIPLPERVIAEIEEIQEVYPRSFQRGLDRAFLYAPLVREEFVKAGLPADLVWLAQVESQFHPGVTSSAGAAGMWQFMKATGARYGLNSDSYVDERYDWEKSTQAAILYLSDLRDRFNGDWSLAVTAYNMGEFGLERAIASANGAHATDGKQNIWKLVDDSPASGKFQEETRKFYSKFLATVIVAGNPAQFGFEPHPQPPLTVARVPVKGSYSLAIIEKECDLPAGTLKDLNHALVREVTPPDREYHLAVPFEQTTRVASVLRDLPLESARPVYASVKDRPVPASRTNKQVASPKPASTTGTTHTVRRGETVSEIASKYHVNVRELMEVNKIRSARQLQSGKRLIIPGPATDAPIDTMVAKIEPQAALTKPAPAAETPAPAKLTEYKVAKGDTLSDIAAKHKVKLADLKKWNGLKSDVVRVNQVLKLEDNSAPATPPTPEFGEYKVQRGDAPVKIAKRHGMSLDDFLKANNFSKDTVIREGQTVKVKGGSAPSTPMAVEPKQEAPKAAAPASEPVETASAPPVQPTDSYTVQAGDYPGKIAGLHGMNLDEFLRLNEFSSSTTIRVGQKVKVRGQAAAQSVAAPPKPAAKTTHTVAAGESPWTVAAKYKCSVDDLLKWNGMTRSTVLKVGDKLTVSGTPGASGATPSKPDDGEKVIHEVAKGQNPSIIAQLYKVKTSELFAWNNWDKDHVLHIGDKVVIVKK